MTGYMSKHMRHNCGEHGCYLDRLPPWDEWIECFPRGIRPTDVDGMVEVGGQFLIMEEKQAGVSIPDGQRTALRRLAEKDGITVVFFRPGRASELEVLIYDGSDPQGFKPCSRAEFGAWLTDWARTADGATAPITPMKGRESA